MENMENEFELHCHTKYSGTSLPYDGTEEPESIIKHATKIGLRGIAITDHDTTVAWKQAREEADKQGILFIPGIEISSNSGHILGLGVSDKIKSRLGVEETVDLVHDNGGIAIAAHPFDIRGHGVKNELTKADAVEVFNALSVDRFSNWLTKSRASKFQMPITSGSDAHSLGMIGRASIKANADDLDSLLKAIKNKKISIGNQYVLLNDMKEWNRIRMIKAYDSIVRLIDDRYSRPKAWMAKTMMRKFMFSRSSVWDFVARAGLLGAIGYSGVRFVAYY